MIPTVETSLGSQSTLRSIYSTYVVRVHTRDGIKTISFDILARYFTYTAKKAAEELGISSRTLIRVCRSLGIRRWPYLGFRSEKNVDRICQEAMESLRRKLERERTSLSSVHTTTPVSTHVLPTTHTPVIRPTTCVRGASAKRLLQVNLPQMPPPQLIPFPGTPSNQVATFPVTSNRSMYHPSQILTPPPTNNTFNLDLTRGPSISPRCLPVHMAPITPNHFHTDKLHAAIPRLAVPAYMPSLNILANAFILSTLKHPSPFTPTRLPVLEGHSPSFTNMSMRDVLAATAT